MWWIGSSFWTCDATYSGWIWYYSWTTNGRTIRKVRTEYYVRTLQYWVVCTYCTVLSTMYVYSAPYWYWLNSYMYIIIQHITSYSIYIHLSIHVIACISLSVYLSIYSKYVQFFGLLLNSRTIQVFQMLSAGKYIVVLYLWVYRVVFMLIFYYYHYDCTVFFMTVYFYVECRL